MQRLRPPAQGAPRLFELRTAASLPQRAWLASLRAVRASEAMANDLVAETSRPRAFWKNATTRSTALATTIAAAAVDAVAAITRSST